MKTIAEIASECGVHRTTLNKAIERGNIEATLYGKTYVIDETSEQFRTWLAGTGIGRPRTIRAETPDAPEWVTSRAAKYAWKSDHSWRGDAARADKDEVGAEQYRQFLLREAERLYGDNRER